MHYDNYNLHCVISIHALLAESDGKSNKLAGRKLVFLSTLSLRRATKIVAGLRSHTPNFYPRSPCGERHDQKGIQHPPVCISIHALLAESDRAVLREHGKSLYFYPRSPCGERRGKVTGGYDRSDFYPRSPCGERQHINSRADNIERFLSTLSLRRATSYGHTSV